MENNIPGISGIRENMGDELSLILFDGRVEYLRSGDIESLGKAIGRYFAEAGDSVRKDSPELFAVYSDAAARGFRSEETLVSPESMRFYKGMDAVPESFTDIYNCYFDSEIIRLGKNEVFVDGGAQDLFTSFRFSKKAGGKFRAIYAFEPSGDNYGECMGNRALFDGEIHISALALSDHTAVAGFTEDRQCSRIDEGSDSYVLTVSLDDCMEGIEPTFIKLHIEGGEYAAILGAEKTISRCAPRLAVCIDHCPEDVVRIPQKLLEYESGYRFYLRHYSTSVTETVLYAVKNRK